MHLPRKLLLVLCGTLTPLAYYMILFTRWGNSPGASPTYTLLVEGVVVLAAFCCWEVVRTEKLVPVRAVAGAVGVPLALVTLLTLWYGLRRYLFM